MKTLRLHSTGDLRLHGEPAPEAGNGERRKRRGLKVVVEPQRAEGGP